MPGWLDERLTSRAGVPRPGGHAFRGALDGAQGTAEVPVREITAHPFERRGHRGLEQDRGLAARPSQGTGAADSVRCGPRNVRGHAYR
jgi:hypothetical protein